MHIIARLNIGGAAASVILTVDALRDYDCETLLVTGTVGTNEGDMAYLAGDHGIEPYYIPELGREISPLKDLRTVYKLVRLMRQWRPDVVHTHTAKAGFVGRLAAWIARVPVRVHTFHGHVFHGYFSPRRTRFYLWLERFSARLSSGIITISDVQYEELSHRYRIAPSSKFSKQPIGLDLRHLTIPPDESVIEAFISAHNLPRDKKLIGIVGRLVPIKHHDLFLDAAQRLTGQRDDVHFVLAGDGERRAELVERAHTLGLADCMTFTGWVADIRTVMHTLDMLVLTSRNEGTPVSIIEGMAAGLPVISTDVGGVRDILEGGELGQVVPLDDPDALAAAMVRALDGTAPDPAIASETALRRYDITHRAEAMRTYYDLLRR
ncbi:MAG: glycosyltransferase family 4 protein [Chloroflexota bacterium]